MTLHRKNQGQGHRERSQLRRSHQGLFPCKASSRYWWIWPRTNLNTEVNQMLTDGQTDGRTDRRTSSIHKPELLCNPAKNSIICSGIFHHFGRTARNWIVICMCLCVWNAKQHCKKVHVDDVPVPTYIYVVILKVHCNNNIKRWHLMTSLSLFW